MNSAIFEVVRIQRTCVHDGSGIRTVVFFGGCGLRCKWCQNPETFDKAQAKHYSLPELLRAIERDAPYYASTAGGVTLSGGEPLLQDADSLVALLLALKSKGISVNVETSLNAPQKTLLAVANYVDTFLVDFKTLGGSGTHISLTGSPNTQILDNFDKLIATNARIEIRMVIVPKHNDDNSQIGAAADFLKAKGFSRIELLKYHNMYEDKAARLGLDVPKLNIDLSDADIALKKAITVFQGLGIDAFCVEADSPKITSKFTDRVLSVQKAIREAKRALCVEVSKLKTEYYKKFKGWKKPVAVHRGERLRYVLNRKFIKVYENELLAGNFTSKRVAGQVWEEQYGILYISFLYKINKQKPVPFECSRKERRDFYFKIFPYWLKHCILVKAHPTIKSFLHTLARTADMRVGFNNNFASIAHYIVNYERFIERGTSGLIAEIEEKLRQNPSNTEYVGMIESLKGLEEFGQRYHDMLVEQAKNEVDAARRAELEAMAKTFERVPKYSATSYREALQSMLILQIALCIEAYENAVSLGRIDQILYPYYKRDVEKGILTYEDAKELLCLFILKLDESILVNDGDGFLSVGKNFETLSIDQALTFGGVDKDGNDATNDITYMLIDACELLPLGVNMVARVHKGSPKKYMERLAEIYINGCPMPELFADNIYIDTLLKHYPTTTIENARNYSIVGCVEPCCSDDHFGNTDCANMNLALPFLQALKGQTYDLWQLSFGEQMEKFKTKIIEYSLRNSKRLDKVLSKRNKKLHKKNMKKKGYAYDPATSMQQLEKRFEERLKALALGVLADQQKIERVLQKGFVTPLCSSLFRGCVERGMDVYEGGTDYNTAGIQAVGVTDVADSFCAIEEVVFNKKLYTIDQIITAIEENFCGEFNQKIRNDLLKVPKFGDDSDERSAYWVNKVMEIYNKALDNAPYSTRNGKYTAGYYALNVNDRYGKKTGALPSGRLAGVPLANSITPHYGMQEADLMSTLNSMAKINYRDFAVNGATATLTIDAALFPKQEGIENLAGIFKTYLTEGGIQLQPNIVSKDLLLEAYHNPEKHKYLMVRVAGYCAYFQELSDELKKIIINRTCYS